MTGHTQPKVVQYRSVHLPAETLKVSDLEEAESPFEVNEKLTLEVIYTGMAGGLAAVYIPGHGNYAVELKFLSVKK